MTVLSKAIILECKRKLIEHKAHLLNELRDQRAHLAERSFVGDEGDLSAQALDENHQFARNQRIRHHLVDIEMALARIEKGTYGICEETQEPIEAQRLLALPWTTLSIEGAELRESMIDARTAKGAKISREL